MAEPSPPKEREGFSLSRFLVRFTTVIMAIVVALLIAEIAMRVVGYERSYYNPLSSFHEGDALVGYRGKPSFEGRFKTLNFDAIVAHDERGFRRQEHRGPRDGARSAMYALGDSFTWGWGVSQGEVFTDQLSLIRPGLYVDNLGLNASGTVAQHRIFETFVQGQLDRGDIVLLMFFRNDFSDNLRGQIKARVRRGNVIVREPEVELGHGVKGWLKDHSTVGNLVIFLADNYQAKRKASEARNRAAAIAELGDESQEHVIVVHYLEAFDRACDEAGARFIAAYIPGQRELGETDGLDEIGLENEAMFRQAFFRCAEEAGVETIDLLPAFNAFTSAHPDERLSFAGDEHWTATGHRVAAEAIVAHVEDK